MQSVRQRTSHCFSMIQRADRWSAASTPAPWDGPIAPRGTDQHHVAFRQATRGIAHAHPPSGVCRVASSISPYGSSETSTSRPGMPVLPIIPWVWPGAVRVDLPTRPWVEQIVGSIKSTPWPELLEGLHGDTVPDAPCRLNGSLEIGMRPASKRGLSGPPGPV